MTLSVPADEPFATIAPAFMGLGYEISSVTRPGLMHAGNGVLVQLIHTLGAQGIIRIGGNTSDYAHYAPTDPPASSAFGTVVNDAALKDLGGFLDATGWKLIWGLDLGRGSETEAIAEAAGVLSAAKQRLLAFEIGNEPDLFGRAKHRKPEYGYEDWLAEYRRYKGALRARFPRLPLAGPDAAGATDWVTRFAADEGSDAVLLTHHYYREHQNPDSSIARLLAPDPKLQPQLEQLQAPPPAAAFHIASARSIHSQAVAAPVSATHGSRALGTRLHVHAGGQWLFRRQHRNRCQPSRLRELVLADR